MHCEAGDQVRAPLVDWEEVKQRYLEGATPRVLFLEFRVSIKTVYQVIWKNGWSVQRNVCALEEETRKVEKAKARDRRR